MVNVMKILFFPKEKYDDDEVYFNDAEFVDDGVMEIINQNRREMERDKDSHSNVGVWNPPESTKK
jgi:hypothetical protein